MPGAAGARSAVQVVKDGVGQRTLGVPLGGVGDEPGLLVEHHDEVVFEEDVEGNVLGGKVENLGRRGRVSHPHPGPNDRFCAPLGGFPVEPDEAQRDITLNGGSGALWRLHAQRLIKSVPIVGFGDNKLYDRGLLGFGHQMFVFTWALLLTMMSTTAR